ncbi:MAG: hypothetical protein ACYC3S_07990 [Chloroflexota bacterium]
MADTNTQPRGLTPREDAPGQPAAGGNVPPWEYERHLESQHNLLVDAEKGWPTAVKRYRLFRPLEGKRAERTLLVFEGTGPAALSHFFRYIHPAAQTQTSAFRPNTYARRS